MSQRFALSGTEAAVEPLIALNAQVLPGMGRRDHAAWVMNVLAHALGPWLVAQDAGGGALAGADARAIEVAAALHPAGYLSVEIEAPPLPRGRTSPPAAAFALARVMAPAVNAIAYAGPIAPRAIWRIAGDGLAWGWTEGETERGREILTAYGAPFANRQLAFEPGGLIRRGGCCRYLAVSGETCRACPLRKG